MKATAWNPLRLRNVGIAALALGLLVGVWLGDLFNGFGLGPETSQTKSPGDTPADLVRKRDDDDEHDPDLVGRHVSDESEVAAAPQPGEVVKVLIDDRDYFLRREGGTQPVSLPELVKIIDRTEPNADGLKAVIDRTATSRVSAEVQLFDALRAAGVPENSVYLTPQAVD